VLGLKATAISLLDMKIVPYARPMKRATVSYSGRLLPFKIREDKLLRAYELGNYAIPSSAACILLHRLIDRVDTSNIPGENRIVIGNGSEQSAVDAIAKSLEATPVYSTVDGGVSDPEVLLNARFTFVFSLFGTSVVNFGKDPQKKLGQELALYNFEDPVDTRSNTFQYAVRVGIKETLSHITGYNSVLEWEVDQLRTHPAHIITQIESPIVANIFCNRYSSLINDLGMSDLYSRAFLDRNCTENDIASLLKKEPPEEPIEWSFPA
jgi:hypothetical protein